MDTKTLPVVPRCIPDELRALKQWVVWRLIAKANDKPTKIPYNPITRLAARSNNPGTWGTFAEALAEYQEQPSRWAGIGFMFVDGGGLVGIDLDKCRDAVSGNIAEWAADIIQRCATYAEVSPSGAGVKLWARGTLPTDQTGRKRPYKTGAVEMYCRGRFFAATGHRLEPGADGVREAQPAIEWLWALALADKQAAGHGDTETRRHGYTENDSKIYERARKYVAAMPAAVSGQGGHDATFEVACKLVLGFRLPPRKAMDIFREYNQRCEPPWSERDLWHKLNSADKQPGERGYLLESRQEPRKARMSSDKTNPSVESGSSVVSRSVKAGDLDPRPQVEALVKSITRDGVPAIRFWRGSFWRWSAGRYREMLPGETRVRMVQWLNKHAHKLTREVVNNHLMQFEAQTSLDSETEPPAWLPVEAPGDWPRWDVLACRNSLVHLSGYLDGKPAREFQRPATPAYFSQSALDFDFSADARPPDEWLKLLSEIWTGGDDSGEVLREWFGYCLTPDTSQHKILLMVGPPRSGKGTIARILRRLVGHGNSAGPTMSSLEEQYGVWPLIGKSLAVISDARLGGRTSAVTERLLSISGEDELTVERKYLAPVTCTLPSRLVILTNELPRFTDASGALASRMLILRFTRSWLGAEDRGLTNRLLQELPGILLWSITGWRRLRDRGHFEEPAASSDVREQLADLSSAVGMFLRERCELGSNFKIATAELFSAYRDWCEKNGKGFVEDQQGFGRSLRAAYAGVGTVQTRVENVPTRFYTGLCLKPDSF